jgi:hypothetical protein
MFRTITPGRRPSRRTLLIVVVSLLLLGTLAVDRTASVIAGKRISAELSCVSGSTPELHLQNFPLLPRLTVGRLGDVRAQLPTFVTDEVTVTAVEIDAKGVALPDGQTGPLVFRELTASFDIPLSLLPAQVEGFDVRYSSTREGLLAVSTTTQISDVTVPITVLASVSLRNEQVILTPEAVQVFGIEQSTGMLGEWFTQVISERDLPALPDDLAYQSLSVTDNGLRVQIGGKDLTMENPGVTECRD